MAIPEFKYSTLVLGVALAGLTLIKLIFAYRLSWRRAVFAREKGCKRPPVLKNGLPFGIDRLQELLKADKEMRFPDLLKSRFDETANTYETNILGMQVYVTCEPENVKALLATQFEDFDLGPTRRGNFLPLFGNGILTQDGKAWGHSRAMMRPQFTREQISDLDLEERHVQNLMRALPINSNSGWTSPTDLLVPFFRLTLDTATEFLLGESVDSQLSALPGHTPPKTSSISKSVDGNIFAKALDAGLAVLTRRLRLLELYWLADSPAFRRACRQVHEFVDHYVHLALDRNHHSDQPNPTSNAEKGGGLPPSPSGKDKGSLFLTTLISQTRDPIEIRSQLLHLLIAGRDTTASLLGWVFLLLSRHPAVYTLLRTTVLADFGSYAHPRDISFSSLKACSYLQHILNETNRIYSIVPFNYRQANKDTAIPLGGGVDGKSPIFVKKGQRVDYIVDSMHRRADIWGPDADEFRPERWGNHKRVGWEFLPFNGGPRICLGQQFSLTEAAYVVVRMVQRFEEIEDMGVPGVKHNLGLTNCSGNGVVVRMKEARAE